MNHPWEPVADGLIDKEEIEFLIALRREIRGDFPTFEDLVFEAVKRNVLTDDTINAEEVAWLRRLFAYGELDEAEKWFLRHLGHVVTSVCPEFQRLYDDLLSDRSGPRP